MSDSKWARPFNKPTDAQVAAAQAKLKRDGLDFLHVFLHEGAKAAGKHLDENPENELAQLFSQPMMRASLQQVVVAVREHRAVADEQYRRGGGSGK